MRRFALLLATIALALGAAAPAGAVQRHVHSITTPGGTHEFGGGASLNAPCVAFLNLHENVHLAVFAAGDNPNGISVEFIPGAFC
jgi:hypothetical protein